MVPFGVVPGVQRVRLYQGRYKRSGSLGYDQEAAAIFARNNMTHSDDQKLEVQQATDIVRLVGEEISLRPKGREYLGLCPFHDDKKPSLQVSATKQIFKCFSCGVGGDVFSFVMNYHKMTFPEALGHLAQRAGIKLRPLGRGVRDESQGRPNGRHLIADANNWALRFFRAALNDPDRGAAAREYLQRRRISQEMVEVFEIGYAPDGWDGLTGAIEKEGIRNQAFESAGLIGSKKQGNGAYDRFRHRLVFPILDALGRPIAFGARRLREEDEPKYLNSPETAIFDKSLTLYGLHLAKRPIIDSGTAVVVEGYTDVIACHQAGVHNAVATLGTAFTRGHAGVLSRLCDRVVLIFDADDAGQKAANRAVDVFFSGSVDVAVAVLPDGSDPAQLLANSNGPEQLGRLIDQAVGSLEYKLARMRAELEKTDTLTGKERVARAYLQDLISLGVLGQSVIRREMVVERLAPLLGVSERAIELQLKSLSVKSKTDGGGSLKPASGHDAGVETSSDKMIPGVAWSNSAPRIRALGLAERQVIGSLLRQPALFHQQLSDGMTLDEALTAAEMITPGPQALYARLHERLSQEGTLTLQNFLADLASNGELELVNLATQAEAEVEASCGDDTERLESLLREAADSILRHHKEYWYQQSRKRFFDAVGQGSRSIDDSQLGELAQHRRDHPSAVRIARSGANK